MPAVSTLGIDEWVDDLSRQATHEDYTVKFLVDSPYITGEVINVDGGRSLS